MIRNLLLATAAIAVATSTATAAAPRKAAESHHAARVQSIRKAKQTAV